MFVFSLLYFFDKEHLSIKAGKFFITIENEI